MGYQYNCIFYILFHLIIKLIRDFYKSESILNWFYDDIQNHKDKMNKNRQIYLILLNLKFHFIYQDSIIIEYKLKDYPKILKFLN